jgi:hypothetical protein
MNVIAERNLFINTSTVPTGSGRDVSINLPQGYADCAFGEQMRMTLSTFLMEKKFYDVNETNNTFFLVGTPVTGATLANMVSKAIVITPGNYKSFGGQQTYATTQLPPNATATWYNNRGIGYQLLTKIEAALGVEWSETAANYSYVAGGIYNAPGTTAGPRNIVVITHDAVTGKWKIIIDASRLATAATANYNFHLFSFEVNKGGNATIVDTITQGKGVFTDTHELLGGCSVSATNNLQSPAVYTDLSLLKTMFEVSSVSSDKATFEGYYQASLKTLEAVYVRTNLSSSNFQTASFDSGNDLYPFVISSDILAKIPVSDTTVTTASERYFPLYIPADTGPPATLAQTTNVQYGYDDCTFPAEYISFIDQGGHTFSMLLNTNHVSQIRMFLTDDKGRLLPWESDGQDKCNEMYFTATLKVSISKPL